MSYFKSKLAALTGATLLATFLAVSNKVETTAGQPAPTPQPTEIRMVKDTPPPEETLSFNDEIDRLMKEAHSHEDSPAPQP